MPNVGRPSRACHACRERRIKCDFIRPACSQCLRIARACPGYRNQLDLVFRMETVASFQSNVSRDRRKTHTREINNTTVAGQEYNPPRAITGPARSCSEFRLFSNSVLEVDHFLFFRTVTASSLAGPFDFGFWAKSTLQASHVYPALWHATIALGAVHRVFMTDIALPYRRDSEKHRNVRFALRQLNKSIKSVTDMLSTRVLTKQDKIVVLTVCVLFTCLSTLQGYQEQAFLHISNGINLLHQWGFMDLISQRYSDTTINMLLLIFFQLDTRKRHIRSGVEVKNDDQNTDNLVGLPNYTPKSFASCLEAYVTLEMLINRLARLHPTNLNSELAVDEKDIYTLTLTAWDHKFSEYLAEGLIKIEEDSLRLLRMRRLFAAVLFQNFDKDELGHDEFFHQYEGIVGLAATILEGTKRPTSSEDGLRTAKPAPAQFSLSVIISEPLLYTVKCCRDLTIRHRALHLLKMYPRRESIIDGIAGIKLLEAYIAFEEKSCPRSGSTLSEYDYLVPGSDCSIAGSGICQKHRITFQQFLKQSGLGASGVGRWRT
ncbi:hypothetical protein BGW36DRAFT_96322 [Talaromyces proteolyticus]|uniref:Zn(2)-C6 fungal-type domain-containing protein n=1 Tax=Talaromyces proteolyticus TaxID=1131652 RepID=A0AAD4L5S6_9EURO|nr:uncharacterized protein BGW36DRAFT_96322 [Talaromyces proteolyticus]KAH8704082.1 hypothetical protein BGW36DRAFT_96322 [Talaromyces proteolyticus]